ncbi:hypothetical protein O6072_15865 [Mycolicibacterium neoaurum]|uniref:hypothetical protein n=1 Tax=Mycolicibacterium neoaurum TaxID=1795 RepID=UPI00248AF68D|nr:hypothetical protein [Mycolicibacterium neoaurum]WBP92793.1 hypothetical protein O7W24_16545 [Mycolicibacterium neoaurum]WBS06355.1 hypothetical protein O6072_15865 [Mycolicibacterium neoaurum]
MSIDDSPASANQDFLGRHIPDVAEFFLEAGWNQEREDRVFNEDKSAKCPECGDVSDTVQFALWVNIERTSAAVLEIHTCEDEGHVWRKCHVGPLDQPMNIAAQVALGRGYKLTLPSGQVLRGGWLAPSES